MSSSVIRPQQGSPAARLVQECRSHFIAVAAFSALSNLLFVVPTLYLMQVYDRVLPTSGVMTLVLLSGITALALGTQSLLDWVRSRILVRAAAQMDLKASADVLWAALSRRAPGVSGQRAIQDFDTVKQALSGPVLLSVLDAPWGVLYLGLTYLLHPALGVLATVVGAMMIAIALINERRTREPLKAAGEAAARGYSTLEAASRSLSVIGALGMKRAMVIKHLSERSEMLDRQSDASFRAASYTSFNKTLRIVVQSASVGLGAYLVIRGNMSAGSLMAASFLLARALAPIEQITSAWPTLDRARNAALSLKALVAASEDRSEKTQLPRPKGVLVLEGVTVAARASKRPVLNNLTFTVEPGRITGIAGASGSGKSTLARTLVGGVDLSAGAVRLDGASLDDWDSEALGQHIGYLPQEFTLFEGTVKENISRFGTYVDGTPESLDRQVIEAAMAVGAHEMILSLPKGYDTRLGVSGSGLSGGQTQRIALARAFFGNPALLVLDEPNAHLDGLAEQQLIQALMDARTRGATVILMAHSRALLGLADQMIVLKNGEVDLSGPLGEVASLMRERRSGPRQAVTVSSETVTPDFRQNPGQAVA
jgi:PrtD family type I secretion system ABC transporter